MSIDLETAKQFVYANARLLDRHRLAVLLDGAAPAAVLAALRAYRNDDGGFGHALEPDVRTPASEPAALLHALDVLAEVGCLDDPMVRDGAAWLDAIAGPDGAVPFVMPGSEAFPHAPWMVSSGEGSHLTFPLAGSLWEARSRAPWLEPATAWCWERLDGPAELGAYWVKFALNFLDHVPDEARALRTIEGLAPRIGADGTIPVPGGTEDERLTPLLLSERPGLRSRGLFTDAQIAGELDRLEAGQLDDGGWTVDFLQWSPGQAVEWRGAMTLWALKTLAAHGRIAAAR